MNKFSMMTISLAMVGCTSVTSTRDIPAVTGFDAARYMGSWHEIARLPQWYEHGISHVTATYALDGDTLMITNRGIRNGLPTQSTAIGHFAGEPTIGEFRVSFFRPFYGDYRIIWLSKDYRTAMVTSSDRSSLWLLARDKHLPPATSNALIRLAHSWNFDTSTLEFPE